MSIQTSNTTACFSRVISRFSTVGIIKKGSSLAALFYFNYSYLDMTQTENDAPHPQVEVALGFFTTNIAPSSPSV